MHVVAAEPTMLPMFMLAIIVLGVVFLLAGGAHLLAPLLHHFGLVFLGLVAVIVLLVALRGGVTVVHSGHVATIDSSGGGEHAMAPSAGVSSGEFVWGSLLKLGLLGALVIGAIVAIAHSRIFAHPHALGVGGAILTVVLGLAALWFIVVPTQMSSPVMTPAAPSRYQTELLRTEQRPFAEASGASSTTQIPMESTTNTKPEVETSSAEGPQPGESNANLPAWVNEPPHWKEANGRTFLIVVRSGLVTDPNLLEEQLENKMVARTNQYIEEQVLRRPGASDVAGFDADYLREHCVRQRYPTDGKTAGSRELFAQLEFDRQFRDEVKRRYDQFVSQQRLQQTTGVAVAAFAVLGGLYLYLRTTAAKQSN